MPFVPRPSARGARALVAQGGEAASNSSPQGARQTVSAVVLKNFAAPGCARASRSPAVRGTPLDYCDILS